jgi:hypothetical protein
LAENSFKIVIKCFLDSRHVFIDVYALQVLQIIFIFRLVLGLNNGVAIAVASN